MRAPMPAFEPRISPTMTPITHSASPVRSPPTSVKSIEGNMTRRKTVTARAYGASAVTVFRRVMLPSMLFTLVGGLRTGLALCVIGVIVGEILGSKAGMGALINHAYGLLRTADYVALVLVTLVLVVGSDVLASLLERRARRWTE